MRVLVTILQCQQSLFAKTARQTTPCRTAQSGLEYQHTISRQGTVHSCLGYQDTISRQGTAQPGLGYQDTVS